MFDMANPLAVLKSSLIPGRQGISSSFVARQFWASGYFVGGQASGAQLVLSPANLKRKPLLGRENSAITYPAYAFALWPSYSRQTQPLFSSCRLLVYRRQSCSKWLYRICRQ